MTMDADLIAALPTNFAENISIDNPATPAVVAALGGAIGLSETHDVNLIEDVFSRFRDSGLAFGNKTQQIFMRRTRPKSLKANKIETGDVASLTINLPEVAVRYYSENCDDMYTTTITEDEFKRSFSGATGSDDFIASAVIRNAKSYETDFYEICKAQLSRIPIGTGNTYINQGYTAGYARIDAATALAEVEKMEMIIESMRAFVRNVSKGYATKYNVAGQYTSAGSLCGIITAAMYDRLTAGIAKMSDTDKILKDLTAEFMKLPIDWIVIDDFDAATLTKFGWSPTGAGAMPIATIFDADIFKIRNVGDYPVINTAVLPEERAINLYLHIKELHELLQFLPAWGFAFNEDAESTAVAEVLTPYTE